MNIILITYLILLVVICVLISIIITLKRKIITANDPLNKMLNNINAVKFTNSLNPLVLEIYKLFISNPLFFIEDSHHIEVQLLGGNAKFWHANDVYARRFTHISDEIFKSLKISEKDLKNLSFADKKILDTIANRIRVDNKAFIDKVFLY